MLPIAYTPDEYEMKDFQAMEGKYVSENEKVFFETMLRKIQTEYASFRDKIIDYDENPDELYLYREIYDEFYVGRYSTKIEDNPVEVNGLFRSKVLRNSDQLDAGLKLELLAELTSAMKVLSSIIYLVSPLFAKQGYIQLTDYGFKLSKEFFELDEKERTIAILVTIPYNLTRLFKEDIFSMRLSPIFIEAIGSEKDKVKRHFLASLLVYKQPEGWGKALMSYMSTIGYNSYYLGTLFELMMSVLQTGSLEETERMRMKDLIKTAMFKNNVGRLPASQRELNQMPLTKKMIQGENSDTDPKS